MSLTIFQRIAQEEGFAQDIRSRGRRTQGYYDSERKRGHAESTRSRRGFS